MYCTPPELMKARSQHRCTNCGEAIEPGDEYTRWASYDDGKCFTNKMHPECLESLQDGSDDFEYTLYGGERPDVVTPNDRVEGRDAASSRRVPSHDGLAGSGSTE